jgi:hypothetical protein
MYPCESTGIIRFGFKLFTVVPFCDGGDERLDFNRRVGKG